jgi:hypothetical protein
MRAVAGVFHSRENAQCGLDALRRNGYSPENVSFLTPGSTEEQIHAVPVSETEQPGVGRALGGAVGAALGMAGGFELGVGISVLIPGIGPVLAAGLAGMALLGAGGAALGVAAGGRADQDSTEGLPADEIFFYEDALRQGRSVVMVMANGKREAERARELLAECGAESIDAARDAWWIGLRNAEAEHYQALGYNFEHDHEIYRRGFEAALRRSLRGKSYEEASASLAKEYPDVWETDPFRSGYRRGREYDQQHAGAVTSLPAV